MARPDDLYQMLIDAHQGLGDADSMKLNAKLVLLLANHIGDAAVVAQAINAAANGRETEPATDPNT
jgi:hypothetical protein